MIGLADRLKSVVDCLLARRHRQATSGEQTAGSRAEQLAAKFLEQQGLRILARNVRYRGGELDLVAEHGQTIVFVEVRLRQHQDFGGAAASISPSKQRRVILAARQWLHEEPQRARRPCRFDVLLFPRIELAAAEWLQAAFTADRTRA